MTEHKDIQDPDDYTETDYKDFEEKLFSSATPVSELEEICMTLAHLPTKIAQDLLDKFRESERAKEVVWLDIAVEEGEFHYLSPENDEEARDYMALKVMQEIQDDVIDLEIKYEEFEIDLRKMEIEHEAIKELVKNGELSKDEVLGLDDARICITSQMEDLEKQISTKEKICDQIKKSLTTSKYKDVDPMKMRNVHF